MKTKEFRVNICVIDAITQIEICTKVIYLYARCAQVARTIAVRKVKNEHEQKNIVFIAEKYGVSPEVLRKMIDAGDVQMPRQYEYITNTTEI